MSLLGRIFGAPKAKDASPHEQWFYDLLTGGGQTAAGVRVNANTALEIPTIFAGVQAISQDIAKLPLVVLKVSGDTRERWRENRLWPILHDVPYEGLTSYRFRQAMQAQVLLRGNAYAEIYRDGRGRVTGLKPFKPGAVTPLRYDPDGTMFYRVNEGGHQEVLGRDRMFHLRGLTLDGECGLSMVNLLRESIGIGLAAQEYAARFFSNDATPRSIFTRPGRFQTDEARKQFVNALVSMVSGSNRHKPLLLEDGLDFKQLGMNNDDAQLIETRSQQRSENAASLRITPHKVGDLSRATFSNVEQMSIDYVQDTIMPHARNWESELWLSLVPEREREETEIKLVLDGLLRGDTSARAAYYSAGLGAGGSPAWLTPNEVRKLEDLNPHPDGDELPKATMPAVPAKPPKDDANAKPEDNEPRAIPGHGAGRLRILPMPGAHHAGG